MIADRKDAAANGKLVLKTVSNSFIKGIFKDFNLFVGISILAIFYVFAFFPNVIAPFDPQEMNYDDELAPPSRSHLLGTDHYGRDIFSRIVFAARMDLAISMGSVTVGFIFGVFLGLISGYFGGVLESLIMRVLDSLLAFPPLILAILVIAFLGSNSMNLIISIGIIYIPFFARVTRAGVLGQRELEYVQASKVSGARNFNIMIKSILPNVMGPILVQTSLYLGVTLLVVAGLSFLGLGVQPPTPSWGTMLRESQKYLNKIWFVLSPGACIFLVVLSFNLVGDGIRDLIDPSMKLSQQDRQ